MTRAALITAAIVLGLLGVLRVVSDADNWPAVEDPPRQCEALDPLPLEARQVIHSPQALARLIREPQNTWSNIAFLFVGACLMSHAASNIARLVGVALIAVGIGSFLYHASASRTLRNLDVAAMYWLYLAATSFSIVTFLPRLRNLLESHSRIFCSITFTLAIVIALGRNWTLAGTKPLALSTMTTATATVIISALALAAVQRRNRQVTTNALAAVALFAVSVICQLGDRPGECLCYPNALFQAHALWHVFSAAAVGFAVRVLDWQNPAGKGMQVKVD